MCTLSFADWSDCYFHINENNNHSNQRKITCTFLYIQKAKKIRKIKLTTKSQALCKKKDNLRYVSIHKNYDTLRHVIFPFLVLNWYLFIYKAHDTFCYVTF